MHVDSYSSLRSPRRKGDRREEWERGEKRKGDMEGVERVKEDKSERGRKVERRREET